MGAAASVQGGEDRALAGTGRALEDLGRLRLAMARRAWLPRAEGRILDIRDRLLPADEDRRRQTLAGRDKCAESLAVE